MEWLLVDSCLHHHSPKLIEWERDLTKLLKNSRLQNEKNKSVLTLKKLVKKLVGTPNNPQNVFAKFQSE